MCTRRGPDSKIGTAILAACALLAAHVVLAAPGNRDAPIPPLHAIRFSGIAAVDPDDLEKAAALRRGDLLTDSLIQRTLSAVVRFYHGRSYFGAEASAVRMLRPDGLAADLLIDVREGLPALVSDVSVSTAGGDSDDPLPGLSPGEPLSAAGVEAGLAELLARRERAGFPFARAWVKGVGRDSAGVLIDLEVDDGEEVEIGEIRVEGNTVTQTPVVLREARMDLPSRFDPEAIAAFTGRLRRLGLFSSVEDPLVYPRGPGAGGHGLLVRVAEGSHSTFDGVIGYAPSGPSQSTGMVTGSAAVALRNLFGTGRRLEGGWSRDGRETQEIRLRYEEPWVAGLPVNAGGGFSQRQQDSSFVDRRLSIVAEILLSATLSIVALGEHKRIIPSSGMPWIPGSSALTAGLAVAFDTRDDRRLPRRGVTYRSEYRTGTRRPAGVSGGDPSAVRHLGLDLEWFLPAGRAHVVRLGAHGREISTAGPQPGDLYRLGGFRTMRGFREDRFSGTRIAWGTAEYRLLAGGQSYVFGFVDPGYVEGGTGIEATFTYGYGVGIRLETGLGLIGVSFALGEGDPVGETKLHVGLINDF